MFLFLSRPSVSGEAAKKKVPSREIPLEARLTNPLITGSSIALVHLSLGLESCILISLSADFISNGARGRPSSLSRRDLITLLFSVSRLNREDTHLLISRSGIRNARAMSTVSSVTFLE